jgi:hypothetical protein
MNTYSLKAHLEQLSLGDPNHLYTMICECAKCADKKWVKVRTAQIPEVATKLGFTDMITKAQFDTLIHKVVQKAG